MAVAKTMAPTIRVSGPGIPLIRRKIQKRFSTGSIQDIRNLFSPTYIQSDTGDSPRKGKRGKKQV